MAGEHNIVVGKCASSPCKLTVFILPIVIHAGYSLRDSHNSLGVWQLELQT